MVSIIKSMSLEGLDGYLIEIQTEVSTGIPNFEIVGLPDASIKEAKERIRAAIKNTKFEFLSRKVLINLAPAGIRKEGTTLDLPMALGVLISLGQIENSDILKKTVFLGELSLNGNVNRIDGILPMCIEAKKLGMEKIVVPAFNVNEAMIIDGIDIIPVENLKDAINFIKSGKVKEELYKKYEKTIEEENRLDIDFSDVKGQHIAKRALEIAASRCT